MTRFTHHPILLIEDDDDVLEAIRELLMEAGYSVIEAKSGSEAMATLGREPKPAAMIVDFMMAGMNGADFLKLCAADPRLARIPSLVVSAGRPADLAKEGIEAYISKPFRPEQLLDALERLLFDPQSMTG
jgi:twitching motility two-component system response regulator PilH